MKSFYVFKERAPVQREAAAIATAAGRLWLPRPGVEAQDEARRRPGGIPFEFAVARFAAQG